MQEYIIHNNYIRCCYYRDDYIKCIACKICLNSQTYASALFNVNIGSGNTTCLGINDWNNKNNYQIPPFLIMMKYLMKRIIYKSIFILSDSYNANDKKMFVIVNLISIPNLYQTLVT